jgi:hypothetical protein
MRISTIEVKKRRNRPFKMTKEQSGSWCERSYAFSEAMASGKGCFIDESIVVMKELHKSHGRKQIPRAWSDYGLISFRALDGGEHRTLYDIMGGIFDCIFACRCPKHRIKIARAKLADRRTYWGGRLVRQEPEAESGAQSLNELEPSAELDPEGEAVQPVQ